MGADSTDTHSGTANLFNCLTANSAVGGISNLGQAGSALGGALFNLDGNVTLVNDTLAANSVSNFISASAPQVHPDGGAVYNLAYGNDIQTGAAPTATLTMTNSILATSTGNGNYDLVSLAVNGTASVAGSNNLVMNSNGVSAGTLITSTANPDLGSLTINNGGLTPTMLPAANNPVLGAGASNLSPATD